MPSLQVVAALVTSALFMHLVEFIQPDFQGWGDVFFFCGSELQFCTCSIAWNVLGALTPHHSSEAAALDVHQSPGTRLQAGTRRLW